MVRKAAKAAEIEKVAPHDLRRTCARLCHLAGGELDQIQFLLGHVSIQTTERYLGCKQKLRYAVMTNLELNLDFSGNPWADWPPNGDFVRYAHSASTIHFWGCYLCVG